MYKIIAPQIIYIISIFVMHLNKFYQKTHKLFELKYKNVLEIKNYNNKSAKKIY